MNAQDQIQEQSLRILLLQIRDQARVREEELQSFAAYSGLRTEQIDVLNVFDTPEFDPLVIEGYDALLVGGASEASVLEPETYPFVNDSIRLLRHCIDISFPVFASCFGFQLAVVALGGRIIRDKTDYEMGTIPISLTDSAAQDPVYKGITDGFRAVSVHMERTTKVPQNCELLAFTDACVHSFRIIGKPFWAFQFHPEVDKPTLNERLTIYKSKYTDGDDQLDKVLASIVDTPESNQLVNNFVTRVLLTSD
ncbi:MAG: type 1 glutamine amidotransferase [Gammaproteobacteria bacterium]